MKKPNTNTHKVSSTQTVIKAKRIKLGIDVHADSYRVVRQVDDATPQPAQKFSPEAFMLWAKKHGCQMVIGKAARIEMMAITTNSSIR